MKAVQNPDIAWQIYDDEAVLVDPDSTVCIVLNETAVCVWKTFETESDIEEAVNAVFSRFDVSREEAARDVTEIVRELINKNILKEI